MSNVILKLSLSVHSSKIKFFLQIRNCSYLVRTQKPLSAPTLKRFSNGCRKTKTKAITPTNHNRGKQRNEPITIPNNYL